MKVLLDECIPRPLGRELSGHAVATVQQMGWAGTENGALLALAAGAGFEAFLTVDRGIEFQQHVAALPLGVVALRARSNDIADLRPLLPAVLAVLSTLRAGTILRVPG